MSPLNHIQDVSEAFGVIKDLLEGSDFNIRFSAKSFIYSPPYFTDNEFFNELYCELGYSQSDSKIKTLAKEEVLKEFSILLEDSDLTEVLRTKDTNKRIEKIFWKHIEKYVSLTHSKFYTKSIDQRGNQWEIFWLILDEKNKRGLLLEGYAFD